MDNLQLLRKYPLQFAALHRLAFSISCLYPESGRSCIGNRVHAMENPTEYRELELKSILAGERLCPSCNAKLLADKHAQDLAR